MAVSGRDSLADEMLHKCDVYAMRSMKCSEEHVRRPWGDGNEGPCGSEM